MSSTISQLQIARPSSAFDAAAHLRDVVDQLAAAIDPKRAARAGRSPLATLWGAPHSGRSTVLRELGVHLGERGRRVEVVRGCETGASVPLAPFGPLLAADDRTGMDVASTPALIGMLRRRLSDAKAVLLVDDAHLLDAASLTLVEQLARDESCPTVLALGAHRDHPDGLRRLASTPGGVRVDLGPLDRDACDDLAGHLVGGDLDDGFLEQLWELTGGHRLLVQLVAGASGGDPARDPAPPQDRAGATERHLLSEHPVVRAALDEWLAGLEDPRLADAVAICANLPEPLAVATFGVHTVEQAVWAGVLVSEPTGGGRVLRFSAGLLRQRHRDAGGRARQRAAAAAVLTELDLSPCARAGGATTALRARLLLALGRCDPQVLAEAAKRALVHHRPEEALELAEAAQACGWSLDGALARAGALSMLRRAEEAETAFAQLTPDVPGATASQVAVGHSLAVLHDLGDADRAALLLRGALDHAEDASAHDLRALLASAEHHRGAVLAAAEHVRDARRSGGFPLDALPGLLAAHVAVGDPETVLTTLHEHPGAWDHPPAALLLVMVRMLALHQVGRLGELDGPVDGLPALDTDAVLDSWMIRRLMPLARSALTGAPVGHRVRPEELERLQRSSPVQLGAWLLPLLSLQSAAGGHHRAARQLLDRAARLPGASEDRRSWWAERAEAAILAAEGRTDEAVQRCLSLANRFEAEHFHRTTSLHDAVRYGAVEAACEPLTRMAARPGATWWDSVCADHARSLAAGDVADLLATADRFEQGGLVLLALEAASQAARLAPAGSSADRVQTMAAAGTIARLRADCGAARTPALRDTASPLTDREYTVAVLASEGLANRAISQQLGTSVRTVANQLQRVYEKLGIHSRLELTELLGEESLSG
jgi:DNA-binding CsgD family transcriptional regulator